MRISIDKLKMVIDELQDAELSYKRQIHAFEKVFREYQPLDKEGNDKRALRLVSEELQKEYQQIKELKLTLMEIVRSYENAEKNIVGYSATFGRSTVFRKIDISNVQRILKNYNITLE